MRLLAGGMISAVNNDNYPGLGGVILPFIGIKLIDMIALNMVS